MNIIVDLVCVDGVWIKVGANMPGIIPGTVTEIIVRQNDPRDFNGSDTAFIEVFFDNKTKLTIKTSEYMYVERGDY